MEAQQTVNPNFASLIARHRAYFMSGKTRSPEWREEQLKALDDDHRERRRNACRVVDRSEAQRDQCLGYAQCIRLAPDDLKLSGEVDGLGATDRSTEIYRNPNGYEWTGIFKNEVTVE